MTSSHGPSVHRRFAPALLAVFTLCFLGLAWLYVPRLANPIWTDAEFSGWVGPLAARLVEGERIYRDFTLPIPPGSLLLLAAVQRVTGGCHIVHDLWVIALCQLAMVWIAYFVLRPLVGPRTAALAAVATAPLLIATPKEIAYDQTAQVVSWTALAVLAHALTAPAERRRHRLLFLAGLLSALTLVFKSSTGVGAIGGSAAGLGLVTALAWHRDGAATLRAMGREWAALGLGIASGVVATAATVVIIGGDLAEFWQVVFVDGPALKGGIGRALLNLVSYVTVQLPAKLTLLAAALSAYALVRLAVRHPLHRVVSASESDEPPPTANRLALGLVVATLIVVAAYVTAAALLWQGSSHMPLALRFLGDLSTGPAMAGLLLLVVVTVAGLRDADHSRDVRTIFAAIVLAALVQSLAHNLSAPQLRLFKDNNVIIPLVLAALFHVLDRAHSPVLKYAVFAVLLGGLFLPKYDRFLAAQHLVSEPGFWQGAQVSRHGQTILRAAIRARELAGPTGTVLVLPEDLMFEALIDRPRPKLFAAAVLVDQFPARALERDLQTLQAEPPDVLVLHPRPRALWKEFYAHWQAMSPAERLQDRFIATHLKSHYRRDRSYRSTYFARPATLEIYVRITPKR